MARNTEFGNCIRNMNNTHKKVDLISEAFRSVVLKCLPEQYALWYLREERRKIIGEEFAIDKEKNARFFTGVNKTKRRRRSSIIRKAVPHSNMILVLLLAYDNFPKSVFC